MDQSELWNKSSSNEEGVSSQVPSKDLNSENLDSFSRKRMVSSINKGGKMKKGIFWALGAFVGVLLLVAALGFFFIALPAKKVMQHATLLKQNVSMVQSAFIERDLVTVEKGLGNMQQNLEDLKASRDENLSFFADFGPTGEYYADSDHFISAGFYAIEAAEEAVELMKPFADAAGLRVSEEEEVVENDSLLVAFSNWVSVMPSIAESSDVVISKLSMAGDELSMVDVEKYPQKIGKYEVRGTIEGVQSMLVAVNEAAPDIKKALIVIPDLLGVGTGTQRYMIIMQNDKEIRPTGGFWTNYATFKINNAMLTSDFTSKDMYSIDDTLMEIDAYFDFPDAPAPYTKYLKVEHWFARDTNSSPDFPTSVNQFFSFYNMAAQINPVEIKPVDGVLAIDTNVIQELMEVTGPVTVNGVTYTSDNVVLELETIASLTMSEQKGRKGVLGDLMEAMLVNVFESDKNLWSKLIEKGIDLATRKHILAYMFDPEAQMLIEKYNLGGRIIDPVEGDYAYVVSTNLGGDKTNWFVTKDIEHSIEKSGDDWVRTVKITYNYPQPSGEYSAFVKRFRDWVRLYVPEGSELISVEGSADDFDNGAERGKVYFDGYIELGPEESSIMTFKYKLPAGVVNDDTYNLYLQKQPGINGEMHTVVVNGESTEIELSRDYKFETTL